MCDPAAFGDHCVTNYPHRCNGEDIRTLPLFLVAIEHQPDHHALPPVIIKRKKEMKKLIDLRAVNELGNKSHHNEREEKSPKNGPISRESDGLSCCASCCDSSKAFHRSSRRTQDSDFSPSPSERERATGYLCGCGSFRFVPAAKSWCWWSMCALYSVQRAGRCWGSKPYSESFLLRFDCCWALCINRVCCPRIIAYEAEVRNLWHR